MHLTLHNLASQLHDFTASTLFDSMLISPYYNSVQFSHHLCETKDNSTTELAPEFEKN
jgi:hypothetical protein